VTELANSLDRPTAIFTKNGPVLEECSHRRLVPVADVFDPILFAWHLGATKPDPAAYERAARALGHDAATLPLVDDAPANVVGPRRSGWRATRVLPS
jgi:HAD superfamily hydrolase (TIGR01509 family)